MDWVLIGLVILAVAINVTSFLVLIQVKRQKEQAIDDAELIQQSVEEFVANVEKENDELYRELVNYIKAKEKKLDERIRVLEEKPGTEVTEVVAATPAPADKEAEQQPEITEVVAAGEGKEKIPQLYKQGFSPKQIARVLQVDHGEVELIINMFNKKQSYQK